MGKVLFKIALVEAGREIVLVYKQIGSEGWV